MKSVKTLSLYVLVALATPAYFHAQTWQPAVRLWGASMNNVVVQVPNGPPLIPLWNGPNAPNDSVWLYSIPTLNNSSLPYQVKNGMSSYSHTSDFNGNGYQDITGSPRGSTYDSLLLDAFGPTPRMRPIVLPNGEAPGYGSQLSQIFDIDGDGVNDVLTHRDADVRIVFGDRMEPFLQASTHAFRIGGIDGKYDDLIALGHLSGKVCMVRLTWFKPTPVSEPKAKYVLEELDADDLRIRRDTIRTHLLQEIIPEKGFAYQSPVILCDSVWWVGAPSLSVLKMLKFTISSSVEVEPHASFRYTSTEQFDESNFYGQERKSGEYPLVIDGKEPFAYHGREIIVGDSLHLRMALYQILSASTLEIEKLGVMELPNGSIQRGSIRSVVLTPDIDGDAIEESIIYYRSVDSVTDEVVPVVDLFLSTGRFVSSVLQGTSPMIGVMRLPDGWLVNTSGRCATATRQVPLYEIDGRLLELAEVREHQKGLVISLPRLRSFRPLFTVVGSCVIRLQ